MIIGLVLAIKFWVVKSAHTYYRQWLDERSEEASRRLNHSSQTKDLNQ